MAGYRLTVNYQRVGVTDRDFSVGFDFNVANLNSLPGIATNFIRGLKNIMTNLQTITGYEWHDIIVRSTKRYSPKANALVTVYYASTGTRRFSLATTATGVIAAGGNRTALGVGMYFKTTDSGGGKSGKFLIRNGISEDLTADTNLSSWPVPSSFSTALANLIGTGGDWLPYVSNGPAGDKMVNVHVNKLGVPTLATVVNIAAQRISKYRSVQPGIS